MMALLEDLSSKAKAKFPRILLPESSDSRVLEAAQILSSQKIAQIIFFDICLHRKAQLVKLLSK